MRFLTLLTATLVATLTASAQDSDSGCTDVTACNYDASALTDDGSCFHLSITGTSEICSGETTELTTLLQGSTMATDGWAYADVVETPSMLTVPGEYGTIAAALSASSDGDTILVAPGTYIGTYDLPSSHGVHLISEAGPDVTTLDGNQAESVLAVAGNGFEYTIQGFTITGGYAYQYTTVCNGKMGGGIEICGGAIVTVQDNIVINNLGRHRGGGIRLASDNCIIRRNVIAFNTTPQGWASYDGGAGLCIQASDFIVENNTICYNNESGNYNHGAGVFIGTTGGTFRNNIVYHNTGGDQIYFQSQGTLSVDYSCVTEAISGTGNITALPLFTDGAAGDFSLQATSPCIDAGDPNSPPDSDGSTSDMGAIAILNPAPEPTSYLWDNGSTSPSIQVQPGANQSYSVEVEVDGHQCEATIDVQVEEYACGDPLACNYDDQATCTDITLCTYPGCTDPDACNYDGNAGCDDGNCIHILSTLDTAICEGQPVELQAIVPESGPNGALNFPNAAQYSGSAFASTANGASSLNITEDFTIEFWLRVDGMHYWHLMGKNTFGNNSQGWLIKKPGTDLKFAWTYVPNEFNFFAPTPGDWQHVAICFDDASNAFTTFINGTAAYSATKDIQINASSFEYVIGRELGTQNWFQGSIDELHISSVVRHTGNFDPDLTPEADQYSLGLWHFDELSGNIAYDASGHGNHLNLSNTIWETREAGSDPSDFQYAWSDGTSLSSNSFTPESTTSMELTVSGPQFSCAQTAQIVVHPTQCDDPLAINYVANAPCGGGECLYAGCMDATACNYNPEATQDDGSCDLCGCLQPPTVVAGFSTNYLLASDGILTGWGTNNMDQTSIPADLPRILKADAAEEYVIWLDEDQNVTIQGGNGPYSNSVPAGLQGIDVAAGRHHMVVVKTDGSLLSLGANYTGLQNEPVVNNAVQGAAGWYHNAAVLDDGSVVGWGDNWSAPANPISNAVAIDAGVDHTLVLKDDFTVEEWGNNINSSAAWGGLTNVVDIAAGGHGSLAIMSDGSMLAWSATDGSILFESDPGDIVLDADIDWGSLIVMYADGSLETALTPPADALAFSDNWEGCGLCASDADGDGICNDEDNACYANANLPVFSGISVDESASGPTTADATLTLDIAGGNPASLELDAINGSGTLSFDIPAELSSIPPGYYTATVLNDDGCAAVASAPGGSTAGEEATSLPIIVSYALCCDCGVSDLDSDGICDDVDNCTDRSAPNYADPANVPCGCVDPVQYQGYSYDVVQVGDQCWFAENLRSESYRNGDPIPNYEADGDWSNAHQGSEGAWCHPNGQASKSDSYGHLYNHWLIMDGREVCPEGWHVPSDADFIELEMFMGMSLETALLTDWRGSDQGTRLKASPTSVIPWDGTDEVGFRWVQGGWRHVSGSYGYVDDLGLLMFTPSAESGGATYGFRQAGNQYQPGGLVRTFGGNAGDGRSLRCLKN